MQRLFSYLTLVVVTFFTVWGLFATSKNNAKVPLGGEKILIADFDRSQFLQKHIPMSKDHWSLESGGENYSYSFVDPDNDISKMSLEMSPDSNDLKKFAISWYGESINEPAKLTPAKESFIRDLLWSILPNLKPDLVLAYIRNQQSKRYTGGSSAMPRKLLGSVKIFCGVTGSGLIVGFQK